MLFDLIGIALDPVEFGRALLKAVKTKFIIQTKWHFCNFFEHCADLYVIAMLCLNAIPRLCVCDHTQEAARTRQA